MSFRGNLVASVVALIMSAVAVGGAHAQSITQALTRAYDYAPDLQAALLNAKSSAENIALAQAGKRPTIGASLSGSYNWSLVNNNFNDNNNLTTGLSYNQTIFDNGQTDADIEAARAGAEAAEYQIRVTEQTVLLAVVQAYMNVYSGRQLVALRQENSSFYSAQLQSSQDRLEVGEGTRIDVA